MMMQFSKLCMEVHQEILRHVSFSARSRFNRDHPLLGARLVCKQWNLLAQEGTVWRWVTLDSTQHALFREVMRRLTPKSLTVEVTLTNPPESGMLMWAAIDNHLESLVGLLVHFVSERQRIALPIFTARDLSKLKLLVLDRSRPVKFTPPSFTRIFAVEPHGLTFLELVDFTLDVYNLQGCVMHSVRETVFAFSDGASSPSYFCLTWVDLLTPNTETVVVINPPIFDSYQAAKSSRLKRVVLADVSTLAYKLFWSKCSLPYNTTISLRQWSPHLETIPDSNVELSLDTLMHGLDEDEECIDVKFGLSIDGICANYPKHFLFTWNVEFFRQSPSQGSTTRTASVKELWSRAGGSVLCRSLSAWLDAFSIFHRCESLVLHTTAWKYYHHRESSPRRFGGQFEMPLLTSLHIVGTDDVTEGHRQRLSLMSDVGFRAAKLQFITIEVAEPLVLSAVALYRVLRSWLPEHMAKLDQHPPPLQKLVLKKIRLAENPCGKLSFPDTVAAMSLLAAEVDIRP